MGLDYSCLGGSMVMRKDAFGCEADLGLNPKSFIDQLDEHIQPGLWFSRLSMRMAVPASYDHC